MQNQVVVQIGRRWWKHEWDRPFCLFRVGCKSKDSGLSLPEFLARYSSEGQCRDTLFKLRWPKGFFCPKCGYAACREVHRAGNSINAVPAGFSHRLYKKPFFQPLNCL
ncbi:MAG: transposase [Desulfobulbus sp.]